MKDIESLGSKLLPFRTLTQGITPKGPVGRVGTFAQIGELRAQSYQVFSLPFGVQQWVDTCDCLEEAVRLIQNRCWELPGLYLVVHAPTATKKYFMATRDCTVTVVPEPL